METVFRGDKLVIGQQDEKKYATFGVDKTVSRNELMVKTLLEPDINGVFLFYLKNNDMFSGKGFMLPPGLSTQDTERFQRDFLALFEKYAYKVKN